MQGLWVCPAHLLQMHCGGQGDDGSGGEMLLIQAWRPELAPPAPQERDGLGSICLPAGEARTEGS